MIGNPLKFSPARKLWTIRTKAQLCEAILNDPDTGFIMAEHQGFSSDELKEMLLSYTWFGVNGLRATRKHAAVAK